MLDIVDVQNKILMAEENYASETDKSLSNNSEHVCFVY